jgi:uncharacterized protein YjiK
MINISKIIIPIASLILMFIYGCPKTYTKDKNASIHTYERSEVRMRLGDVRNASGITFNPDSNTLFIVQDSPTIIHEINFSGNVLRSITLKNMDDVEGITHLGGDRFAIIEESSSIIYFLSIKKETTIIDKKDCATMKLDIEGNNYGIEGITYDAHNKCLYVIKEKKPKKILRIYIGSEKVEVPFDLESINISDAAGIVIDPRSGHLLILSEESKCIIECTIEGKELARLSLYENQANLKRDFKKPEGITIDPKSGKIFTCGENNEFYIFSSKK